MYIDNNKVILITQYYPCGNSLYLFVIPISHWTISCERIQNPGCNICL